MNTGTDHTIPADTIPADTIPADTIPADTIPADTIPDRITPAHTIAAGVVRDLSRSLDATPTDLDSLHARLVVAAQADGVLDITYRIVDTPVGPLLLAATDLGLVRVAFAVEDHDAVLQALAAQISPRILAAPARLEATTRELDEYFAGRRQSFDLILDWRLSKGFRSTVLHALPSVAYGSTATYAAVAQLAGNPKAVRAVGSACATNPLPVVVPCHRVVRSDGAIGGYLGGADAKRTLLAHESAASGPTSGTIGSAQRTGRASQPSSIGSGAR